SLADESDYNEENLFHDAEFANRAVQGGLEKWLVHAFQLNGGGIRIEVADFYGKMHAEDSLSREVLKINRQPLEIIVRLPLQTKMAEETHEKRKALRRSGFLFLSRTSVNLTEMEEQENDIVDPIYDENDEERE
ncbi:hypothetical protein Gotri_024095, partial [Gossypium trilobum]|nr:hypothetical protein [Gossypium trilobum]